MPDHPEKDPKQPDPIGDPPSAPEPIKVYEDEDQARDQESKKQSSASRQSEKNDPNDEETMPIEEGFSIVP